MSDKRIRIILDSKGAKRNADELNQSVRGIGDGAEKSQFSVNKLAAAIAAVISTQKIAQFADAFTRVQNQLIRTVSSTEELAAATQQLLDVANQTRAGIEPTVELYTALTVSTKDLAISQVELVDVTKTINNLFLESGKGASETAGAIRQLGQALESGALRGDEFNSVAEGAPGILRAIQLETGLTRAELRELAEQGEITAELIVRSLQNYSEEAQKAADKTQITLAQAYTVADNNLTLFIGKVDAATGASAILANTIVGISEAFAKTENIKAALDLLEILAVVVGTRLVVALGQSASAFVLQQAAALRATVTMNAFGQVTARTTVLSNALALASRGAATAMAFLGGPLGVLAIVAASLVYFSQKSTEAEKIVESLGNTVDGVAAKFKELGTYQKILAQQQYSKQIEEQKEEVEELSARLETLKKLLDVNRAAAGSAFGDWDIKRRENQIVELSAELEKANEKLLEFQMIGDKIKLPKQEIDNFVNSMSSLNAVIGLPGIGVLAKSAPFSVTAGAKAGSAPSKSAAPATDEIKATGFDAYDELQDALDKENANLRVIQSAQNVTKSLEQELALRRQIADIYRSNELGADASFYEQQLAQIQIREAEERAIAQAKFSEEAAQREERLAATLENDKLTDEARKALKAEFDAQEILATQILEEEKTRIKEDGKNAREELDRAERENAISAALSLGDSLMILTQGQNKKAFELSKKVALASAGIAGAKSAIEAWRSGMETSGPWAPLVAAAYTAASLAKTSGLISRIKSVNYSGGGGGGMGGGGAVSIPSVGGGSPSIPSTASAQQVEQRRVYELRGVAGNDKITVDQFRELMEQDGAVVVLSDSVNDASRRNVTGVTAR